MSKFIDCTNAILGVPLLYDRTSRGYGVSITGHVFNGTRELYTALAALGRDLEKIGWLSRILAFLSAGTQVSKGSSRNAHRLGKAVDFDGFIMRDDIASIYMYEKGRRGLLNKTRTRFACLCSLHFGVVLGDFYDSKHKDHIHADLSKKVEWRNSESQIGLLQATCNAWFGADLVVDRVFGQKTEEAMWKAAQWIGVGYVEHKEKIFSYFWHVFIHKIAFTPPRPEKDEFN